ncbi:hypothetical protein TNCV_2135791 [Trichonephila clavipes]|nr:hypothetical protein TNCV_2135791 [Trichonephila clavipes]
MRLITKNYSLKFSYLGCPYLLKLLLSSFLPYLPVLHDNPFSWILVGGEAGPCQKNHLPSPFTSLAEESSSTVLKNGIPRILFDDFCFFPRRPTLPQAGSSPLRASEKISVFILSLPKLSKDLNLLPSSS